ADVARAIHGTGVDQQHFEVAVFLPGERGEHVGEPALLVHRADDDARFGHGLVHVTDPLSGSYAGTSPPWMPGSSSSNASPSSRDRNRHAGRGKSRSARENPA